VIRNAVLHLNNEQPMLADLFELPATADIVLRCTNLRTLNGKRPVFVDDSAAVFFFPYLHIRFVEIPPSSNGSANAGTAAEPEEDLEIDEDFLRRIREV
jgi:hypothetical protein